MPRGGRLHGPRLLSKNAIASGAGAMVHGAAFGEPVMGLFDMWREARGNVMRKEFEDVMGRIRTANDPSRRAFFNNVEQTIEPLRAAHGTASPNERKAILKQCKRSGNE